MRTRKALATRPKVKTEAKPERLECMSIISGWFLYLPAYAKHGPISVGRKFYSTRSEAERAASKHPQQPKVGRLSVHCTISSHTDSAMFHGRDFVFADNRPKAEYRTSDDFKRRTRRA